MQVKTCRVAAVVTTVSVFVALGVYQASPVAQVVRFAGPTSSQPLALSAAGGLLAVVNPDNDSVTFFDVAGGVNVKLGEVAVGDEPNGVALSPSGSRAYVANTVSSTVSVLSVNPTGSPVATLLTTIGVGTEPYGVALTPNGTRLYVTNARSNTVSVIDTASNAVVATIGNVGFEPRGIAISNDGDADDLDETVYITQFLSLPIAGKVDGEDDAKAGHVTVISAATNAVTADVALNPLADSGFKSLGDALARIPPGTTFDFATGAYANQLNNIAIRGNFAFIPNTGASPNGPFRFDVNTHSLLHVIDRTSNTDAGQTINMHTAVRDQTNPLKRFLTVPWAMAFKHSADQGFVISAASNVVVKLDVNIATGAATVQVDPLDPTRVLELPTQSNPRGIVINASDTRAFVMNFVSRSVTVIDLTTSPESVVANLPSAALPAPGTSDDVVHIGKELYNTSVGVFDPVVSGGPPIVGRMSNNGWGACVACHPFGLTDNVVWIFPDGPRRTIPQNVDFAIGHPERQKLLNWSAVRDEEEDFELNIRAVSGGQGLIVLPGTATQDTQVFNLRPLASGDRVQLKVRGVNAWDAIEKFVQSGIRTPISPLPATDPVVQQGRALFIAAGCQTCHGGRQWTSSRLTFTPPPSAARVVEGQIFNQLKIVGTFDPTDFNEVKNTAAPAEGDNGFVPASLLGLHAYPQTFLHGGGETSLRGVLANKTHRSAGTGGVDTLAASAKRNKVIKFLLSIDANTQPIP
jgi:YVTN family beta-propeller protein